MVRRQEQFVIIIFLLLISIFGQNCYQNDQVKDGKLINRVQPKQQQQPQQERRFTIDKRRNQFMKDGQPFQYVSGSIHYFRVPRGEWRNRMMMARYGGLNAIQTYIEWASHEPQSGVYDFTNMLNFTEYFDIAQELNLAVIVRLGPFIASERDNMGLPYWLSEKYPKIKYRTMDEHFMNYVERWYNVLLPKLIPYLYENGGPIIMGQVENEYGSYWARDQVYLCTLRDLFQSYFKNRLFLFTVDGAGQAYLEYGTIAEVYATVDFGAGNNQTIVNDLFQDQRYFDPVGPLVNTEYYPGWFDVWGEPHSTVSVNDTLLTMEAMLKDNASINIYMYHGGTSFGFMNGALITGNGFRAMVTSYDYDAPINDYGEPTPKFYALRKLIQKYLPYNTPELSLTEEEVRNRLETKQSNQSSFNMTITANYVTDLFQIIHSMEPIVTKQILTFEQLELRHGFIYYQTQIQFHPSDPIVLSIPDLHDRALIYVNEIFRGTLSRMDSATTIPLFDLQFNDTLGLLVENQGHTCCSETAEQKGILGNLTIGGINISNGQTWFHYRLFTNWSSISTLNKFKLVKRMNDKTICNCEQRDQNLIPTFYSTTIEFTSIPETNLFLDPTGCGRKGVAFWNGFNLGRYWPVMGPQVTLYVPRSLIKIGTNQLILLELERNSRSCLRFHLTDRHIINGRTPHNYGNMMDDHRLGRNRTSGIPDNYRPLY